jgi:TolB-like protein
MRRIIASIVFVLLAGLCYAQQAVVAVAPFEARAGIALADADTVTEMFSIQLSAAKVARVVTRAALDKVMQEHKFQMSDWSDDSRTATLGKALNANWVVRGVLQKLDGSFIATVSILDVKTLEVMGGGRIRMTKIGEAFDLMKDLVDQTTYTITGGSGQTSVAVNAAKTYKIGDKGPGGGVVFYAADGVYMECSPELGWHNQADAMQVARNYRGGGFNNWRLPTKDDLNLIYQSLIVKRRNIDGFSDNRPKFEFSQEKAG